jgi:hypothetical protein
MALPLIFKGAAFSPSERAKDFSFSAGLKTTTAIEPSGFCAAVTIRSRAEFAIGGTYSGLYVFKLDENQRLQAVQKIEGFNASSRFFEEDARGNIWVGQYYKGLYRLSLSEDLSEVTVQNLSETSDLPIREQVVLSRIGEALYVGTHAGLYRLDPLQGTVRKAEEFAEHIGNQPVYLLGQDQKNNVHLVAEDMVAFFKQVSPNHYLFVPSSLYQLRYHLNNDLLQLSTHTARGVLFAANEGFIHYDPSLEVPLKIKNPLLISRVYNLSQGEALYAHTPFAPKPESLPPLRIGPKAKVLKFSLESFQFNGLGTQQFRYYLKGFDEDFGEWTSSPTKEYTNLREGRYEFTAQTRNYLGEIQSSQALFLNVSPPFYRSTGAKILYVLLALVLLFLVSRLQKRRYNRKAKKIEEARQLERASEQQKRQAIERHGSDTKPTSSFQFFVFSIQTLSYCGIDPYRKSGMPQTTSLSEHLAYSEQVPQKASAD